MLTDTERAHIEEMAEAARQNAFRTVHDLPLLNRMLAEHTAALLAEIDRLRSGSADAVYAAITYGRTYEALADERDAEARVVEDE